MKKKLIIKEVCKKCGKTPPIDKEMSNENWTVYLTKEPCECGGTWTIKVIPNT